MKRVGEIIPAQFRNCGASYGLEYPYIHAHDLAQWIIWHRHTGEIVHIEDDPHPVFGPQKCTKKAHELNGVPEFPDPETLAAIDATP